MLTRRWSPASGGGSPCRWCSSSSCSSACSCSPCRSTNISIRAAGSPGWEPDMHEVLTTEARKTAVAPKDVLTVEGLKAYYINEHFGVRREVRAVDDISLTVHRNEVYGIAGESSSGKSSLIKTLAGAIRPPMRVIDGSVKFDFGGKTIDVYSEPEKLKPARWRHLSYIM